MVDPVPVPPPAPVRSRATTMRVASLVGCVLALGSGALIAELTQAAGRTTSPPAVVEGVAPTGMVADIVDGPASAGSGARTSPSAVAFSGSGAGTGSVTGTGSATGVLDETAEALRSADAVSSNLRSGRIITGATSHRLILFTFDDGPDARYTRGLLDALDAAEIRAVFFLTARRFQGPTPYERGLADLAREIAARGHHVGSHSMDHVQLPLVTTAELAVQVDESAVIFERELGALPAFLRPPGGSRSPRIDDYLAERGFTQMLWNLGTGDVVVRSSDEVLTTFRRVLEVRERDHGERGGIVLLHDIHAWSVEAFPRIVAYLDRRNCDLLARGEELYDFVEDPAIFFDPRGPADATNAEAHPEIPDAVIARRQVRARARAEARCSDVEALDLTIASH